MLVVDMSFHTCKAKGKARVYFQQDEPKSAILARTRSPGYCNCSHARVDRSWRIVCANWSQAPVMVEGALPQASWHTMRCNRR